MANVNFSEEEYFAVCTGASRLLEKRETSSARLLNELASKMNKSLSIANNPAPPGLRGKGRFVAPGPIDVELGIVRTVPK